MQMIEQGRGGRIIGASSVAGKSGESYDFDEYFYANTIQAIPLFARIQRANSQSEGSLKLQVTTETLARLPIDRDHLTAFELGKYDITVNAYAPGLIQTPMSKDEESVRCGS